MHGKELLNGTDLGSSYFFMLKFARVEMNNLTPQEIKYCRILNWEGVLWIILRLYLPNTPQLKLSIC